jgi:hypothetical protein
VSQIPRADPGLVCPLHRKPAEEVCHTCPWWLEIRGRNPNTGVDVDQWGCAVSFLPMLLIENAAQARGAAAATEDARNGIVSALHDAANMALGLDQRRTIDARPVNVLAGR